MGPFVTSKGMVVHIGRELGKGGEGSVYETPSHYSQVAKLYNDHHMPDFQKQAKLSFMVRNSSKQLLDHAAMPLDTLHKTKNGAIVGFIMPKVAGYEPIHMLYSPAHRRQNHPKVSWSFLLRAARNTAAAFATLHSKSYVIGDVNQGNVLVGEDSKVMLIDCDSFQVTENGSTYFCEVGVSHFTPPELQGLSSFRGVMRTYNHDNFGLALLIFHLLFGGRHPYSGKPLRHDVGDSLEADIKAFRFAYAKDGRLRGFEPPPGSIPFDIIPETMQMLFEAAFTERGVSSGRPSAQQWVSELDDLHSRLKRCSTTTTHTYPNHLGTCPWCALENKGVVYFIDIGFSFTTGASGFVLSNVWAAIEAIPSPSSASIPVIGSILVTPTPLPQGVSDSGQVFFLRFLVVGAATWLIAAAPATWWIIALGAWFLWGIAGESGEAERKIERDKRQVILNEAQREFESVEKRIRNEIGPEGFSLKKQELTDLRNEYQSLPAQEKNEIDRLHATAESRQKHRFLESCFIDSANIPGVGLAKKSALRSFGIETAADVSRSRVQSVRGFGEVLTRAVVDWKKSCERRFIFNPYNAVSESDKNVIRAKIAARKRVIETSLIAGASDLQRFRQEAMMKANVLYPQINAAAKKLAQAQADLNLLHK